MTTPNHTYFDYSVLDHFISKSPQRVKLHLMMTEVRRNLMDYRDLPAETIKTCTSFLSKALKYAEKIGDDESLEIAIQLIATLSTVGGRDTSEIKVFDYKKTVEIKELSFSKASFGYQTWHSAQVFAGYSKLY